MRFIFNARNRRSSRAGAVLRLWFVRGRVSVASVLSPSSLVSARKLSLLRLKSLSLRSKTLVSALARNYFVVVFFLAVAVRSAFASPFASSLRSFASALRFVRFFAPSRSVFVRPSANLVALRSLFFCVFFAPVLVSRLLRAVIQRHYALWFRSRWCAFLRLLSPVRCGRFYFCSLSVRSRFNGRSFCCSAFFFAVPVRPCSLSSLRALFPRSAPAPPLFALFFVRFRLVGASFLGAPRAGATARRKRQKKKRANFKVGSNL